MNIEYWQIIFTKTFLFFFLKAVPLFKTKLQLSQSFDIFHSTANFPASLWYLLLLPPTPKYTGQVEPHLTTEEWLFLKSVTYGILEASG